MDSKLSNKSSESLRTGEYECLAHLAARSATPNYDERDFINWKNSMIEVLRELNKTTEQVDSYDQQGTIATMEHSTSTADNNWSSNCSLDSNKSLMIGTGQVSKDCSQDTLDEWHPVLKEWDGEKRLKGLEAIRIMKIACERKIKKLKQHEEEFHLNKKNEERMEKEARLFEEKFSAERKKLQDELKDVQMKLLEATEKAIQEDKRHLGIVQDYKQIIQRQEQQITKLNLLLEDLTKTVSLCQSCSSSIHHSSSKHSTSNIKDNNKIEVPTLGPLDPLNIAQQRIRELELELAQTKLAQVEAECKNQDLNHQLNTTINETQSSRKIRQTWLSKISFGRKIKKK